VTAGRVAEPRALLLSGTGRYADPWHPFAETSAALTGLLREQWFGVEMAEEVDAALAHLAAPGGPAPGGRPLLVSHVSSTSFLDSAEWTEALGGRRIRGTSMHPEYGPAAIHLRPESGALGHDAASYDSPEHRELLLRAISWLAAG